MTFKTSEKEEEYFARKEFERRQKMETDKQKAMQESERNRLKELHHMRCPKCGMQLIEVDYKSVKIDECSNCKGIWLDHNELEQVIEMEKSGGSSLKKLLSVFK